MNNDIEEENNTIIVDDEDSFYEVDMDCVKERERKRS